jgi:N,N'-diacetyllegionaminate synthase
MRIGTREINREQPPYIIAELGVNHDGSLERALELTRLAAEAGADAVKLQYFEAGRLMSRGAQLAAYQKAAGEVNPFEMLRRLEMTIDDMAKVVSLAHDLGIHAIVTVFSPELVEIADRLPWDAYKTASPDIVNKPLIDALGATGRPLIISTGASTIDEVSRALTWMDGWHDRVALLQCVSSYPTPADFSELGGIRALAKIFTGPVGYSDHTAGVYMGAAAVGCGAMILEKHLTYDRAAKGPDHAASLEHTRLRHYKTLARQAHAHWRPGSLGISFSAGDAEGRDELQRIENQLEVSDGTKRVLPIEADVRRNSRQSLFPSRPLAAGHVLARGDLTTKRPGIFISPHHIDAIIGRSLASDVDPNVPLMPEDIAPRQRT